MNTFDAIAPSFILMFVGFIYGKIFKDDLSLFTKIATWLMAPVVTFTFINNYVPNPSDLVVYAIGLFLTFIVSLFISKLHGNDSDLAFISNMYVNSGYLGYPVLLALWGEKALALGVVYSFLNVLYGSTLIPIFITGKLQIKNLFKLPFIYALILGWGLGVFGLNYKSLPTSLVTVVNNISNMAIPFLLLQIGISISRLDFKNSKGFTKYLTITFEKLIILPLVFVPMSLVLKNLFEPLQIKTFILETAMPIALNTTVVIASFRKEKLDEMSLLVAITTIFSVITLPFWAFVLDKLF